MRKIIFILFLLVVLVLLTLSVYFFLCEQTDRQQEDSSDKTSDLGDPIMDQLNAMSMEEKIGQLVITGVEGYEFDAKAQALIEKYKIGGFVLFKKNIRDPEQMLELLNSLKKTNEVNSIPLFLAIDEEGGRISRLPDEFWKTPSSQKIAEINDSEFTFKLSSIVGERLKACGFNMNFAPVLDVNSNPNNPVIGDRSFSHDPSVVSIQGIQTMKGLRTQNIIPVAKHFPGHGDTVVDSHLDLPVLDHNLDRLYNLELIPFALAIENQIEVIMSAHILLPKLDPDNPASLSPNIISKVLREDLGFEGLVITDDLTMGAVLDNYDIREAAVQAIIAGSDIVLVCHDFQKEEAVLQALRQAVENGDISLKRIEQSVYKILKLKQKYNLTDEIVSAVDYRLFNQKLETLYRDYPGLSYLLEQ